MKGYTPVVLEEVEEQIKLWLQLAHEAYGDRQLLRALNYLHRALDYAQERGQARALGLVCRDLGYVYAQEESPDKALAYLDMGLAIPGLDLSVQTGLMANKACVLARRGAYRTALRHLEKSSDLIRTKYHDFSDAPSALVQSYAAIARMATDLRKVVELLDMGVRAERIQVEIKRRDPPWLASRG